MCLFPAEFRCVPVVIMIKEEADIIQKNVVGRRTKFFPSFSYGNGAQSMTTRVHIRIDMRRKKRPSVTFVTCSYESCLRFFQCTPHWRVGDDMPIIPHNSKDEVFTAFSAMIS